MFQTTNQHNFVLHVKHIQASTVFAWVWRTTTKLQHIQLWRSKPKVVVISYIYIYHNIIYRLRIYIYIHIWMYIRLYNVIYSYLCGLYLDYKPGILSRMHILSASWRPSPQVHPFPRAKAWFLQWVFSPEQNSMTIQRYAEVFLQACYSIMKNNIILYHPKKERITSFYHHFTMKKSVYHWFLNMVLWRWIFLAETNGECLGKMGLGFVVDIKNMFGSEIKLWPEKYVKSRTENKFGIYWDQWIEQCSKFLYHSIKNYCYGIGYYTDNINWGFSNPIGESPKKT